MRPHALLCAALGVQFATGFDTAKYLDDQLWDQLRSSAPELVGLFADLGAMLDRHDCLHFDGESAKRWGDAEITLFTEAYFPTLEQAAVTAVSHWELIAERCAERPKSLLPLGRALEHLLLIDADDAKVFNVVPMPSEDFSSPLLLPLRMAEADFMALRSSWTHFDLYHLRRRGAHSDPQWPAVATSFGLAVKVACAAYMIGKLSATVRMRPDPKSLDYLRAVQDDPDNLPSLTLKLQNSISALPQIFSELQKIAEGLVAAECHCSWIDVIDRLWEEGTGGVGSTRTRIWTEFRGDALQLVALGEFLEIAQRFCANLLVGTLLLGLKAAEIAGCSSARVPDELPQWLKWESKTIQSAAAQLEAYVAEQRDAMAEHFAEYAYAVRPRLLNSKRTIKIRETMENAIRALAIFVPRNGHALQLGEATIRVLKETWALAKRVAEAYASLFELARIKIRNPSQMDRFLQSTLGDYDFRAILVAAKTLMDRIQRSLPGPSGMGEEYNWDRFPICFLLCRHRGGKSARTAITPPAEDAAGCLLLERKRSQDDGPVAKRRKLVSDQEDARRPVPDEPSFIEMDGGEPGLERTAS